MGLKKRSAYYIFAAVIFLTLVSVMSLAYATGTVTCNSVASLSGSAACYSNSDCISGFFGTEYCMNNDVFKNFKNSTCMNPGACNSYCTNVTVPTFLIDCGVSSNGNFGDNYCKNGNIYHSRTNTLKGCQIINIDRNLSGCFTQYVFEEVLVQQCANGCTNGVCNIPIVINCTCNSDCGTNSFVNGLFCLNNSVYQNFMTFTCNNAGTPSSYCSNSTAPVLKTGCLGGQTCNNGSCINQTCKAEGETIPVISYPPQCCSGLILINPQTPNIVGISGICTSKCGNGVCDSLTESSYNCPQDCRIICYNNSQCGTNSFSGNPVCQNNSVYQNYITYTCNNAGTPSSSCSNSTMLQLKQNCTNGCLNGICNNVTNQTIICNQDSDCGINQYISDNYCSGDNVYRDYRHYVCNNPGAVNSNCTNYTQHRLIDECTDSCMNGQCQHIGSKGCYPPDCSQDGKTINGNGLDNEVGLYTSYSPGVNYSSLGLNQSPITGSEIIVTGSNDVFGNALLWVIIILVILIVIVVILVIAAAVIKR